MYNTTELLNLNISKQSDIHLKESALEALLLIAHMQACFSESVTQSRAQVTSAWSAGGGGQQGGGPCMFVWGAGGSSNGPLKEINVSQMVREQSPNWG